MGERRLILEIFKNFWQSLKPRQITGNKIGKDHLGNVYYEIPADISRGKRRPSRWFTPEDRSAFDQEIPAEWESWLRFRRIQPPSEEEIMKNLKLMDIKKQKALEIETKYSADHPKQIVEQPKTAFESFPKYDDYEVTPGVPRNKNK
ncbi:NADH dehydrogenase [ubiquinone] 1 alpha subcomplex assembly factor 2 [Lycorma delicatula]|uniref:NADH dehydrogenase [ubiquinone] 1 alpha subcomplex assembly factor 2 n=1 Tax=Lycorma delicatula TaxID=130591 RepID=UPI003F50D4D3